MDIYSLMHKWTGFQVDSLNENKKSKLQERNEFLNEISYESAERIERWFANNPDSLSFDDLFDGKLRKIIELDSPDAKILKKVMGVLKSEGWNIPLNEYDEASFEVKSVKHIDTELAAAGGGERAYFKEIANLELEKVEERVIPAGPRKGEKITSRKKLSVSKIIARSKVLRETDKKWWQSKQQYYSKDDNWQQIENIFNKTQKGSQHIVLSRHPMDILRMSDIDKIRSCHSEDGEYFECAVHEAQGNGPIAYLVDSDDLADFLHRETTEFEDYDIADEPDAPAVDYFDLEDLNQRLNTLDSQEIFRDKKRGVRGIGAAARLRLRKFEDTDTETEFAVPERVVYGPHPPGFKKVIMNWAWNGQKHFFRTPDGDEWVPDRTDVGRHGGRWEDTKDGKLLNAFFDNLPGFRESEGFYEDRNVMQLGEFDDAPDLARIENQVRDMEYMFNSEYDDKNVHLDANVVEMDSWGGGLEYNITATAQMTFAFELPKEGNLARSGELKEFPPYQKTDELYTGGKLEHIRKAIINRLSVGVEQVSDLTIWSIRGGWLYVTVEVQEPDMEGTIEGLESFITDLEMYYEDSISEVPPYQQAKDALADAFRDMGYLAEEDIRIFAKTLKNLDDELEVFELYGVEFDGDEITEIEDPIELECYYRKAFTINEKLISMLNKDLLKQMFGAAIVRQRQTAQMLPAERTTYFTVVPAPGGQFAQLIRAKMGPLLRKARIQIQKDMEEADLAANQARFKGFFRNVSRGEYGLKIDDEGITYYIKFEFPKRESREYLFGVLDFAKYLDKNISFIDKSFKEAIKEIFEDFSDYIKAQAGNQTQDDEEFEEEI